MTQRPVKKRANLRDVAKASGVSVATVSRVLNTPATVRPETRQRVEAQIAELGFIRSAAARAINSGRSKILGALIPTLQSDIFAHTIEAIETELTRIGFSLVVATTAGDPETEARKAQDLLDIGVEGLFLTGVDHSDDLHALIERTRVPAVALSFFDVDYHLPTIGYDNRDVGRMACRYLFEQGHQRIAVIHGPTENNDRTRARLEGVKDVKNATDLTCFMTELSAKAGAEVAAGLAPQIGQYDAILCLSDVLAYGAMFELQRNGISIPDDISVMGIHDMPLSEMTTPRLTTIRLPAQDMGATAAKALANWVERGDQPSKVSLPSRLIPRDSTRSL